MKVFLQCGIVEHSGHGVPIVVREYGENAYTFSQNMITVTIPFNKPKKTKNEPVNEPVKLTKSATKVLQFIQSHSDSTIDDIAKATGISRETVKRALKVLKDNEYITRVGSDKTGH